MTSYTSTIGKVSGLTFSHGLDQNTGGTSRSVHSWPLKLDSHKKDYHDGPLAEVKWCDGGEDDEKAGRTRIGKQHIGPSDMDR